MARINDSIHIQRIVTRHQLFVFSLKVKSVTTDVVNKPTQIDPIVLFTWMGLFIFPTMDFILSHSEYVRGNIPSGFL